MKGKLGGIIYKAECRWRRPRSGTGMGVLIAIFLMYLAAITCSQSSSSPVTVSGKTVYSSMGLEGVPLRVMRWRNGKWEYFTQARSGYHGSFVVHLPKGRYLLTARTILRRSTVDLTLQARLENLEIPSGVQRVDQVVLELTEERW